MIQAMQRMGRLRQLRIELGQKQRQVAERALQTGKVREHFSRISVVYAEQGIGLTSAGTRDAIALGLGLTLEILDEYLFEDMPLQEAVSLSSIRPDPAAVARLKAAAQRRSKPTGKRGASGAEMKPLPNLAATLVWCEGQFPAEFLRSIERFYARRIADLPRAEWLDRIRGRFHEWRERQAAVGRKAKKHLRDRS